MPGEFRPYEPDQGLLLPPSLRDWLPEDHLAFFISDTIDAMDLSAFDAHYGDAGPGNQAFDPCMMVKVLLYAYATGTFSSRKIAAKLHEDVAFRVLGADNFPAHRTISDFRQRHLAEFQVLFVQLVQMAREVGLVKLGTVAVDGSKMKANASKHKAMSYGRMKQEETRLRQEIRDLTARARKTDAQEDKRYGKDRRKGREPGDQDRTGKPGKPFKRRFGEPEEKAQENFTDPDSRIMKRGSSGYEQCYNAQIAVDETQRIIVAVEVTQKASDVEALVPMLDQVEANTGTRPDKALADAGYRSESNLRELEKRKIAGFVAFGRDKSGAPKSVDPEFEATARMARKMKTQRGREQYRKRKYLAEPPFAWIKSVMGFRCFSLRGVEKVTAEWSLACLAANLRRMNHMMEWT